MLKTKDQFSITKSTNIGSGYATYNSLLQESDTNNPQKFIQLNSKYTTMYNQFLKNHKELQSIVKISQEQKEHHSIKSFISKSLSVKKKMDSFEEKFSSQFKMKKKKPIMTMINAMNTITQKIGQTEQVKKQSQKKMFFSQTKKVLQLQEDCLLLEYYYKDRSQFVPKDNITQKPLRSPNISYLRTRNHSEIKHKRIQPNQKEYEKLYLTHNEGYFEKRKTINYVKEQKFKNESYHRAEMNYQFRREKNFAQMAEITQKNRENTLVQNQNNTSSTETKQKQTKFSKVMKLFLKFAYLEQSKRAYYDYINIEGMENLAQFIINNEFCSKLTQQAILQIFQKIIKYKSEKIIEFFDFIQFLDTIQENLAIDLLDLVQQKYPHFFIKVQQTYLQLFVYFRNQNQPQINKEIKKKKIKLTLKLIFESAGNLLILGQFLPVKQVPHILSNVGITGSDISRMNLFEILYWNQRRPEGLSFHEFYFAFLMLGIKDNSYENIFKLMSKVKIGEILQ